MNLEKYCGKNVSVLASNGKTFRGIVDDFFFADDNDSGMESIVVKTNDGEFIEFPEDDISEIMEI
jgi:hypothetical protein